MTENNTTVTIVACRVVPTDGVATNWTHWCETHDQGTDEKSKCADADVTALALVATIKESVNGAGKYVAYVTAHGVTRETVKYHAAALATFAYPNEKPVQRVNGSRTKFGNAVQAAGAGLRTALGKQESPEETVANLLTTDGLSTLKEMLTAKDVDTDALVKALAAEIERRSK